MARDLERKTRKALGWAGQNATKILKQANHLNKMWISYEIKILGNEATERQGKKAAPGG